MAISYSAGTVSIANGANALTGSGTAWVTNGVKAGDIFEAAGLTIEIASVNSATSITLARGWPGSPLAGNNYSIRFTPEATRVLTQVNTLLATLNNGVISNLAGVAGAADKLPYMTGPSTWGLNDFKSWARTLLGAADKAAGRTALDLGAGNSPTFAGLTISGTATLSGGKLAFPATQVPSGNANTLDDYEEGTWTPGIAFGGAAVGLITSVAGGAYVKVGRLVICTFSITLSAKGSSTGPATITGFPFAPSNEANSGLDISLYLNMAGITNLMGSMPLSGTVATLRNGGTAASADVTDANFTNITNLRGSAVYIAAA
ncbi:hypothetical protein [Hoeflea sp.]|uniref:hypothetical protein n=1 Tax=Hoeflea sp. TaxID=1940281 RepID=UPI0019927A3F|nr:hypothetical protein [Hoeflea sp.]MBC7280047.1 hypothetical protein [Hoeflea sp.]